MPILDLETRKAREGAMLADPRVIVQRHWPTGTQIAKAGGVGCVLIQGTAMYVLRGYFDGSKWDYVGYYDGDTLAKLLGEKYSKVEQFNTEETLIQRIQRKLKESK